MAGFFLCFFGFLDGGGESLVRLILVPRGMLNLFVGRVPTMIKMGKGRFIDGYRRENGVVGKISLNFKFG